VNSPEFEKPMSKPGGIKRKAITISEDALIRAESLVPGRTLPLMIQAAVKRIDPIAWIENNKDFVEAKILKHGGIVFRDFNLTSVTDFERFVTAISRELLEYQERSSPRSQVGRNIYTSTDYPAEQSIFLHNENSYQNNWPLRIFFFCDTPAKQGGETPIADCRRIFEGIDTAIREQFIQKKWMLIRNYNDGFGLPWQTVFQTNDKAVVEDHCRKNGIIAEWKESNRLRTIAIRPAVARHPGTGEIVWFNHATFFHVTTLEPKIRDALLAEFGEEDLPTNTYYGDRTPIEPGVLDLLRDVYRRETVSFPWQRGDLLMLDNMLAAHGRAPFVEPRKILVAMAESYQR